MKDEEIELVHGSDNVFRDFGDPDADVLLAKALLASQITKLLDREGLTVRAAHARTRIAAADFSRIRRCDLKRFTVDRLMTILNRLGVQVEVKFKVRAMKAGERIAALQVCGSVTEGNFARSTSLRASASPARRPFGCAQGRVEAPLARVVDGRVGAPPFPSWLLGEVVR